MSPATMQSTNASTTLTSTLPKLTSDGSNWIVWKMRMDIFLGSRDLTQYLDGSTPPPDQPHPLADDANEESVAKYEAAIEKRQAWARPTEKSVITSPKRSLTRS